MKKLIILVIFSLFCFPTFVQSAAFSHIKLGYVNYQTAMTTPTVTWMGNRFDIVIADMMNDYTTALSANPDILLFSYVGGNGIAKYSPRYTSTYLNMWDRFLAWLGGSYQRENIFLHYRDDKTWSWPGTSTLIAGYPAGTIPGYNQGSATDRKHSRIPSIQWGSAISNTKTISTIVRSSNVVTVTTSVAHGFEAEDRITIAGVTDESFNDSFDIVSIGAGGLSATTFTYAQSAANASSSGGTATYYGKSTYAISYAAEWTDFIVQDQIPFLVHDAALNKMNGLFFDSIPNHLEYLTQYDFSKCDEVLTDGGEGDIPAWIRNRITTALATIKEATVTYLSGTGKTAYVAVNGDHIDQNFMNNADQRPLHQDAAIDVVLTESGMGPGLTVYSSYLEGNLKNLWDLVFTYDKKVVLTGYSYATRNNPTWILDSGAIYYTDSIDSTVDISNATPSSGSLSKRTSKAAMTGAGTYYYDITAKRLYVWATGDINPTTWTSFGYNGADRDRFFSLNSYYLFVRYGNNGYFQPWFMQSSYNIQPNDARVWYDALAYDIGQSATGGQKRDNSGNWSTGTDLWAESCTTSSKAYEMWRGDGIELDNNSVALSSSNRLYARKFDNGYSIVRYKASTDTADRVGTRPKTFTTPFNFRKLRADGTLEAEANSFTISQGEGVILITNYGTPPPAVLPTVTTASISSITFTSASSGGNVEDAGGGTVSARGVCWNMTGSPTTADSKTTDGEGTGVFESSITGLNPSTSYYVRAYATNEAGTAYGGTYLFNTPGIVSLSIGVGPLSIIKGGSLSISW